LMRGEEEYIIIGNIEKNWLNMIFKTFKMAL
jgi:hypothetical protein